MKKFSSKVSIALIMAITVLSFTSVVYGKSIVKKIEVVFNNISVSVNGNKVTLKDAYGKKVEPFTYNGTIYVPIQSVSEAIGQPVTYNSKELNINIGKKPDGQCMSKILTPYEGMGYDAGIVKDSPILMGGTKYYTGYYFGQYGELYFNLNGKYKEITMSIGILDGYAQEAPIAIYGDDDLIKRIDFEKGDLPKEIKIDVTGVNKLIFSASYDRLKNGNSAHFGIGDPVIK